MKDKLETIDVLIDTMNKAEQQMLFNTQVVVTIRFVAGEPTIIRKALEMYKEELSNG